MDQNGQYFAVVLVVQQITLSAYKAFQHRIYRFEVGGVRDQVEINFLASGGIHLARETEVVLYISVPKTQVGIGDAFKFIENVFVRLAEDVGQDVESTAVGHAYGDGFYAQLRAFVDGCVEGWDGILTPFE